MLPPPQGCSFHPPVPTTQQCGMENIGGESSSISVKLITDHLLN